MSFLSTFAVGDPQQLLWLYLGLDHTQRARLRCAWKGYNRRLHARTPSFRVPLGNSFEVDYYVDFQNRARVRVEDFRRDSLAGSPPVNEGGFPVYAAWDRLTGRLRPEPFRDVANAGGGRVWVSNNRAAPLFTAIADPRYWRGDQVASWRGEFPDAARWPRLTIPAWIPDSANFPGTFPVVTNIPRHTTWLHDPMPAPMISGHRGEPLRRLPPDPTQ